MPRDPQRLVESTKHHTIQVDTFGREIAPLLDSEEQCSALVEYVITKLDWADNPNPTIDFENLDDIAKKIYDICTCEVERDSKVTIGLGEGRKVLYELRDMTGLSSARGVLAAHATPTSEEKRPSDDSDERRFNSDVVATCEGQPKLDSGKRVEVCASISGWYRY